MIFKRTINKSSTTSHPITEIPPWYPTQDTNNIKLLAESSRTKLLHLNPSRFLDLERSKNMFRISAKSSVLCVTWEERSMSSTSRTWSLLLGKLCANLGHPKNVNVSKLLQLSCRVEVNGELKRLWFRLFAGW